MNVDVLPRLEGAPDPVERDPRPIVAKPNPGLPGLAIAVIVAIIATLLFLVLDSQRRRSASDFPDAADARPGMFAAPPPLVVPPEPAPEPTVVTIPIQPSPAPVPQIQVYRPAPVPAPAPYYPPPAPPPPPVEQAPPQAAPSSSKSALIYDVGGQGIEMGRDVPAPVPTGDPEAAPPQPPASRAQRPARPVRISNPATVVPSGTLIKAVLETPIDTSRPGLARAIVSKDARGFDGRRVLIPRGSRLIGEYGADVRTGQHKVLVNWTELVRPDGVVIKLDSPAADALGGAGVPGRVNSFFFQRFFNSVLQTALALGGSYATYSSEAPVIVGLPNTAVTTVTSQSSLIGQSPQPRIKVKQGTAFNVFVARDLDFSGAPLRR